MTLLNRPRSWEEFTYQETEYVCGCGETLWQCVGTDFLVCAICEEVWWLV